MLRRYHGIFRRILLSADVGAGVLALGLTWIVVRQLVRTGLIDRSTEIAQQGGGLATSAGIFIAVYVLAWLVIADRLHLYSSKRVTRLGCEALDILKATTPSAVIASLLVHSRWLPGLGRFATIGIPIFWALVTMLVIGSRAAMRYALRRLRTMGYNYRSVLIVGTNERSKLLAQKLEEHRWWGIRLLGFVDDLSSNNGSPIPKEEFNIIGDIGYFQDILREHIVDEVFITLPIKSFYTEIAHIIRLCEQAGVPVKFPSGLFPLQVATHRTAVIDDFPLIDISSGPKDSWQLFFKRIFDIAASTTLLVVLSPVLVITAFFVKLTSKGPILFRQRRLGLNHRVFTLYKFRSMVHNAEGLKQTLKHMNEVSGPVFKIRDDPRVTRVGRLIRKLSVDELPQLINVLKGDMSLVGPRPPIPHEVERYDWWQRRRLSMRPGITCLWQVGGRSNTPFEEWVNLDLKYIDNWSLRLDFVILAKTVPAVLRGNGAS